jgi:uncharacterized membrane protein
MWTRASLKNLAKSHLTRKYWMALLVAAVTAILGGGSNLFSYRMDSNINFNIGDITSGNWQSILDQFGKAIGSGIFAAAVAGGIVMMSLIGLAYSIFVGPVIHVGGNRWFSRNREADAIPHFGQVFSLFKAGSYLKTVGSMLWMALFLFLWSLLAIIPLIVGGIVLLGQFFLSWRDWMISGNNFSWLWNQFMIVVPLIALIFLGTIALSIPVIIKQYSYRMTPWILADNPAIGYQRALKLSMDLTRGHKWNIFVLDLSFLGWYLLCVLIGIVTCGIGLLSFFFLAPYVQATQAELYAELRHEGVTRGSTSMEELGYLKVEQPTA